MKFAEMKVDFIDVMGSDLTVVNAARVSFDKTSGFEAEADGTLLLKERDAKLIEFLAEHNHWTPFGHCFLQFRIKAPIFVARQLVKHQVGLVWNEVSRRYVDDEPEFWLPKEWRKRAENKKQGSSDELVDLVGCGCIDSLKFTLDMALGSYHNLLTRGVAPEQARIVLPQNTMTEWYWSGSLAAFARVCNLRLDPHAQLETAEIAKQISQYAVSAFPVSWKALTQSVESVSDEHNTQ